jgi:hypothetical protein
MASACATLTLDTSTMQGFNREGEPGPDDSKKQCDRTAGTAVGLRTAEGT